MQLKDIPIHNPNVYFIHLQKLRSRNFTFRGWNFADKKKSHGKTLQEVYTVPIRNTTSFSTTTHTQYTYVHCTYTVHRKFCDCCCWTVSRGQGSLIIAIITRILITKLHLTWGKSIRSFINKIAGKEGKIHVINWKKAKELCLHNFDNWFHRYYYNRSFWLKTTTNYS